MEYGSFAAEAKLFNINWGNLMDSTQNQQIIRFFQPHLQAFETEKLVSSLVLSIESFMIFVAYLFFFTALYAVGWQGYRYVRLIKEITSAKKFRFSFFIQSFFVVSPLLIAGLAAAINGYQGIFWVFSFLGFCLLLIFLIDRALKPETVKSK